MLEPIEDGPAATSAQDLSEDCTKSPVVAPKAEGRSSTGVVVMQIQVDKLP